MLRCPVVRRVGRIALVFVWLGLWCAAAPLAAQAAPPTPRTARTAGASGSRLGLGLQTPNADTPPDLYVTQTMRARGLGQPGSQVMITLRLGNRGEGAAEEVTLVDMAPAILTNLSFTASGVTATPLEGMTYVWDLGTLAPGDQGEIVITGYTATSLDPGDIIGNQARISSASEDRDPSDNVSYLSWAAATPCWLPLAKR